MTEVRRYEIMNSLGAYCRGGLNTVILDQGTVVVLATDFDALAARVQAVEREIASQDVQMNAVRYRAEQAEQQLAAMMAERDGEHESLLTQLKANVGLAAKVVELEAVVQAYHSREELHAGLKDKALLSQQLAASQARVREYAEELQGYLVKIEHLADQLATLQATLKEREERISGLEAELEEYRSLAEKLGAEKAVSERDTARQDAARLRDAALWAMKKVKRLSTRAIDYKRADDFIQHEEALKGA